jgi:hypothetical protein
METWRVSGSLQIPMANRTTRDLLADAVLHPRWILPVGAGEGAEQTVLGREDHPEVAVVVRRLIAVVDAVGARRANGESSQRTFMCIHGALGA